MKENHIPGTLKACLGTQKGLQQTLEYLKKTKIATRQWILRSEGVEEEIERRIGWGTLEERWEEENVN